MSTGAAELRSLTQFAALSDDAVHTLSAHAHERRFATGEVLFREGARAHGIYIVLHGAVRVVRTTRGRRHVLHTEHRGGTLGEAPCFGSHPYLATAIASGEVRVLHIDLPALERATRGDSDIALFFLSRLGNRIAGLLDRVDGLAAADVGVRLSRYLVEQCERTGSSVVSMTQQALAEELGTVREVVMRTLRAMRAKDIVRTAGRGRIEILDIGALRAAAGEQ